MTETPTSTPVILTNEQQPVLENSKPKSFSTAPKWETAARERMRAAIKKFAKPLADLSLEMLTKAIRAFWLRICSVRDSVSISTRS